MTYIKGYEDGIKAVCEVLRGLAASAEHHAKSATDGHELARISYALLLSTREQILEQLPILIEIRTTQNFDKGKVH